MAVTVINLSDPVSTLVTKTNTISSDVGDRLTLTTAASDLVTAINEINGRLSALDTAEEIALAVENYFDSGNTLDIGGLTFDSGRGSKFLKLDDDARLIFGTDSDFVMYHGDSDQSMLLRNLNLGKALRLRSDNIVLQNDGGQKRIESTTNDVRLYYASYEVMSSVNTGVAMRPNMAFQVTNGGIYYSGDGNGRTNIPQVHLKPFKILNSSGDTVFSAYMTGASADSAGG